MKKFFVVLTVFILLCASALFLLSRGEAPSSYTYGVSFSKLRADELHLDWKETYEAILNDLGVRHFRLVAHWPMIEPEQGIYDFEALDYQMDLAREYDADIILAIGRRTPSWPECHTPEWAKELSPKEQNEALLETLETVVLRYKDHEALLYWQVENEPFLTMFAYEHCGDLDTDFLDEEIALVKTLDPGRQILITDSGNLGTWTGAYTRGDIFGTSIYRYLWNPDIGPFKSILPSSFYRAKGNVLALLYGKKEIIAIEISAEPWLLTPIVEAPISLQLSMMNEERFADIIAFSQDTYFARQYFWGAEWWYSMKNSGRPEFWERAKKLF